MSVERMDIDSVASPGKSHKSHQSSKKRKRPENVESEIATADSEKKKKKKKKEKHGSDNHTTLNGQPSSPLTSKKSKKKTSKRHRDSSPESLSSFEDGISSPEFSRKPLSKSSLRPDLTSPDSIDASSFSRVTSTLYLPLSPISISPTHAVSSLLAEHISPLLLTYYPPASGIILAYSNPSISSTPPSASSAQSEPERHNSHQEPLTLAVSAGEYGVLFVYLTITFLVFRPERGQTLEGWINVQSEDFLGVVVFNLFSVGIERRRLPADWKWVAPGERPQENTNNITTSGEDDDSEVDSDKENFTPLPSNGAINPGDLAGDAGLNDESDTGYFQTRSGKRVRGTIRFRVRDVDVIPGSERDKGFLSLEGTMLSPEEENKLVSEERNSVLGAGVPNQNNNDGVLDGETMMTGAIDNPDDAKKKRERKDKKEKRSKKKEIM
ncbi:hypothetical protein FQN57_000756 [Myotisia sp. PD_48]|nr:hypothetical protein FQN57_000756 [Myotisia sp. PD_48]